MAHIQNVRSPPSLPHNSNMPPSSFFHFPENMSSKINSTVSTSSIIVKQLEKKNLPGKKMAFPSDLNSFRRQIQLYFDLKQPVTSLFTEDGEEIFDVFQIMPSTTIFASTRNGAVQEPSSRAQRAGGLSLNESFGSAKSYESDDDVNNYRDEFGDENDNINQNENANENENINDESGEQSPQKISKSNSQISNKGTGAKKSPGKKRKTIRKTIRKVRGGANRSGNNDDLKTSQRPRGRLISPNDKNNSDDDLLKSDDENDEKDHEEQENENMVDEENENFQNDEDEDLNATPPEDEELRSIVEGLLGPQFCGENFQNIVNNALAGMDTKTQNAFKNAAIEENKQQRFAFQNLLSSLPSYTTIIDRANLTLCGDMIKRANDIINRHRTITTGCVAYNLKSIIAGPRHSGKSTLLAFVAEQFLTELTIAQIWKRNFIFIFDAKKLAVSFSSYIEFYNAFVDLIFNLVRFQRPGFVPYVESVCNYFKGILQSQEPPKLPKRFETNEDFRSAARALKQIGLELYKCTQDPAAFMAWHTNVLLMPSLVASAFGFSQIHYIIDNAEYLDAEFAPSYPFVDTSDTIDIVEYFKYTISNASFAITCENLDEFIEVFGPREDSVDLIHSAEFDDVFGFQGEVYGQDKAFMVKFEGDPRSFKFTVADCGGCPAFLSFWEEMCREVDDNNNDWNVPSSEYNEQQMSVKSYLEHILKHAFVVSDEADESEKVVQQPILEIKPTTALTK